MRDSSVLIVGAGAVGLVTAFHLQLARVNVTLLVRPSRLTELQSTQKLYCYDDHSLKELKGYQLTTDIKDLASQSFDFVFITLDGAACRSPSGVKLLQKLGAMMQSSAAHLIIGGVGIGLLAHIQKTTGLEKIRLIQGSLGMLCYQSKHVELPTHPSINSKKLALASLAYHHFPNKIGFYIAAHRGSKAHSFATLYNRNGISLCKRLPINAYNILSNMFYPLFATFELAGWPNSIEELIKHEKSLWLDCCNAQREIIALKQHGLLGKAVSFWMTPKRLFKLVHKLEQDSLPLNLPAFNRFHHGKKVLQQDIQIMQNCLEAGKNQHQTMSSLENLLIKFAAKKNLS